MEEEGLKRISLHIFLVIIAYERLKIKLINRNMKVLNNANINVEEDETSKIGWLRKKQDKREIKKYPDSIISHFKKIIDSGF